MSNPTSQGREPPLIEAAAIAAPARPARLAIAFAILGGAILAVLGAIALHMSDDQAGALKGQTESRLLAMEDAMKAALASRDMKAQEWFTATKTSIDAQASRLAALDSARPPTSESLAALEARLKATEEKISQASAPLLSPPAATGEPTAPAPDLSAITEKLTAADARLGELESVAKQLTAHLAETGAKAAAIESLAMGLGEQGQSTNAALAKTSAELAGLAAHVAPLDGRLAALDNAAAAAKSGLNNVAADLAASSDRLAALEATLTAAKSDVRVTQARIAEVAATPNSAAVAVIAQSALAAIREGSPLATQVAALQSLGVEPSRIAALKLLADKGAAAPEALAGQFKALAPAIVANARPAAAAPGGVMDWLGAKASSFVQVETVGENAGVSPGDLVAQIAAVLERGDAAAALQAFDKLPDAAKAAAREWASQLRARQDAEAAARGLLDTAIKDLGARKS